MRNKSEGSINILGCKGASTLEHAERQGQRLSSYISSSSSTTKKYPQKQKSLQSSKTISDSTNIGSPKRIPNSPILTSDKRASVPERILADEYQLHVAPTLPLHSPHSPLHPHSQVMQQNKLSARYINNTINARVFSNGASVEPRKAVLKQSIDVPNSPKSGCNCEGKTNAEVHMPAMPAIEGLKKEGSSIYTSKLICSCEMLSDPLAVPKDSDQRKDAKVLNPPHQNVRNPFSNAKRMVATRNAATSPNLDLRKLGSMTTLLPSSGSQQKGGEQEYLLMADGGTAATATVTAAVAAAAKAKLALEKSNSLGEAKPQKQLRNTRSLSPRPPVRHQQAVLIASKVDFVSAKLTPTYGWEAKVQYDTVASLTQLPSNDEYQVNDVLGDRRKNNNNSRSEQTSPNITDLSDIKFTYNRANNKSTGCLVYVPTDPWLKMSDLEQPNAASGRQKSAPQREKLSARDMPTQRSADEESRSNPWVRRTEITHAKSPKHERFRQAKSFSATKFNIEDADKSKKMPRRLLQRCKSPIFPDDCLLPELPLQSAPSSPHYAYNAHYLNSPTRSASFSPVRGKEFQNPFVDSAKPNSQPPSISVAAALVAHEEHTRTEINRSFLDVCNPNLLQARHSFSSVSTQRQDDELQLNIRRLSEQMRKPHSALRDEGKMSLSDRNVTTKGGGDFYYSNIASSSSGNGLGMGMGMGMGTKPKASADFSDYLKQFQCSEAKKAAAAAHDAHATLTTGSPNCNKSLNNNKSASKSDSVLETTC